MKTLVACNTQSQKNEFKNKKDTLQVSKKADTLDMVNAPEINTEYGWLNTDTSYSIKDFRGKIVLLDFWTFGCINCHHILPEIKKLEQEYRRELVVIGIHSAKFEAEKTTNNIKKAILKFDIGHPVVNDADYKVWNAYTVKAWPTLVLINPEGKIVFQKSGEGAYRYVKEYIDRIIKEQGNKINRTPITFQLEKNKEKKGILRFPSKMVLDTEGNLLVTDSGNHRILKISPEGKILLTIGSGKEGFQDGYFAQAAFSEPQGLALKGNLLYIADTKNHAIRVANLQTQIVQTLAGNGKMGYYYFEDKWGTPVNPNSPWDLWIDEKQNLMYIANAGNHQILQMNLQTNQIFRFAGTGREALTDGDLKQAAFNQPSGLVQIQDTLLYVADAEASAIRQIDLKNKTVKTIIGKGLFDFGDIDGSFEEALLQHCVGISKLTDNQLLIADTYNGKIKIADLQQKRIYSLALGFEEPNQALVWKNTLWVSDTNNHQIVKINLLTNERQVLNIQP
ncbi:MAG: thioredoxin-like domain-containing protein [Microscillaceae bacterium]|nr:thioredoxin-like domain-containing protein [Microscillaceae bacterium]MDW8460715.1 thioredoxin-like domain-containing protein [Cytophagales bacterium]